MRIAQLVVVAVPRVELVEVDELPAERARGERLRLVGARVSTEPRIRVSALLSWRDRILLCRHEKPGQEYWLLPGGGVNSGESLVDALRRELVGGDRDRRRDPGRGADRDRRLDRARAQLRGEARRPHHLLGRSRGPVARGGHLGRRRRARPPAVHARGARRDRAPSADPAVPGPLAARAIRPSTWALCGRRNGRREPCAHARPRRAARRQPAVVPASIRRAVAGALLGDAAVCYLEAPRAAVALVGSALRRGGAGGRRSPTSTGRCGRSGAASASSRSPRRAPEPRCRRVLGAEGGGGAVVRPGDVASAARRSGARSCAGCSTTRGGPGWR